MNMVEVAGHLIMRRAQLEKGKRNINASEIIGNLTVQNMNLESQMVELVGQVKLLNDQRNAKQTELAKLNGTSAPEPVRIDEKEEVDNGIEMLNAHARSLVESLKALDELLAAHKAKTETKEVVPSTVDQAADQQSEADENPFSAESERGEGPSGVEK